MRLEFEKHTVKTSWAEKIIEACTVLVVGAFTMIIMTALEWVLVLIITQWGKG